MGRVFVFATLNRGGGGGGYRSTVNVVVFVRSESCTRNRTSGARSFVSTMTRPGQ